MSVTDYTHFFLYKRSVIITELASSADRPESNQSEGPLGVSVTDWLLRTQKTSEKEKNITHGSDKEVRCPNIIELLDIDHVFFYPWWIVGIAERKFIICQASMSEAPPGLPNLLQSDPGATRTLLHLDLLRQPPASPE